MQTELFRFYGILGDDTGNDGYVIVYFDTETGAITRETYADSSYTTPGIGQSSYSAYDPDLRGISDNWFLCGQGALEGTLFGFGMQGNNPFAYISSTVEDSETCSSDIPCDLAGTATAQPSYGPIDTANGSITVAATSSNAPIFYSIDNIIFGTNPTIGFLEAGDYIVYVKDNALCEIQIPITVPNIPCVIDVTATSTKASSAGASDGTITATATGGVGAVQYSKNGSTWQSSNVFTSLIPGTYTIFARDSKGCIDSYDIGVAAEANCDMYITIEVTNETAPGANDGTLEITAFDYVGDVRYSIDGYTLQPSGLFTGLAPGSYIAYAIVLEGADAGCYDTDSFTIEAYEAPHVCDLSISIASTNETASGANNGTITITATTTGGAVQYSKDGGINFQSSNVFTGLAPGVYSIVVEDSEDCQATGSKTILAYSAPGCDLVLSATKTDQTVVGVSNGIINATATSSNTGIEYSKDGVNWQSSGTFTGLAPGVYNIRARDAGACTANTNVTISAVSCDISLSASKTNQTAPGVNNGTITATATTTGGSVQYSKDGSTWQSSGSFTGLAPGTYTVYARDASGCIDSTIVVISVYSSCDIAVVSLSKTNQTAPGVNNGTVTALAASSYSGIEYSINGTAWFSSGTFTGLAPGNYTMNARDSGGCAATSPFTISAYSADPLISTPEILLSSGFTSRWNAAFNPVVFTFAVPAGAKIQVEIQSPGSETGVGVWSPNASNIARVDISAFLAGLVSVDVRSKQYTIRYRTIADFGNGAWYSLSTIFRATYSAMQLGDIYGGNMAKYLTVNGGTYFAYWMTEFIKPVMTVGLPFDVSFIRSEYLAGRALRMRITAYDAGNTVISTTSSAIASTAIEVQSVAVPALPAGTYRADLQLYYVDSGDKNVSEILSVSIKGQCSDPFIYMRWINKLGGWDYYRFGYNQSVTVSTANNTTVSRPVLNWATGNTIFDVIDKRANDRVQFGDDSVDASAIDGITGLAESIKAMVMVSPGVFHTVEVVPGSFSKGSTRNRKFSVNFSINLPEINIQRQ